MTASFVGIRIFISLTIYFYIYCYDDVLILLHKCFTRLARRESGLSHPVKYFTDRSKAVLFCGSCVLCMPCVCHAYAFVVVT